MGMLGSLCFILLYLNLKTRLSLLEMLYVITFLRTLKIAKCSFIQTCEESLYVELFHLVPLTWITINNSRISTVLYLLKSCLEFISILLCFSGLNFKLSNTKL